MGKSWERGEKKKKNIDRRRFLLMSLDSKEAYIEDIKKE